MKRGFIIIEAAFVGQARALAKGKPFNLPEEAVITQFHPTCSPTGKGNATHHIASGVFTDEAWAALEELAASRPWAKLYEYNLKTEPARPFAVLIGRGLKRIAKTLPL